jgi:hypothetical protein
MKAEKNTIQRTIHVIRYPASLILIFSLAGCVHPRQSSHRPTDIDPKEATADFWFARPGVASADSPNFDRLWDAAEHVARRYRFEIDQSDPRQGVMTTLPLVSQTIWEVWRDDLPRAKDQLRSSLAEYRQIMRVDFLHLPDGTYRATPRVLIQRHAQKEHRVTIADNYQRVFLIRPEQDLDSSIDQPTVPNDYWYATGRDYALERDLAVEIAQRVVRK